jgi:sulfatase maturation enzyme AslB (radical SAM superfamily)
MISLLPKPIIFPIKSLKGKYCLSPFVMIEVGLNGDVRLCGCGTWMPTVVGNLINTPLHEILASKLAAEIRQSIIQGTYQFCNERHCGIMANHELNDIDTVPENVKNLLSDSSLYELPHWINIHGDNVCNLSCPSCRNQIIKTNPAQIAERERIGKIIADNLFAQPTDKKIVIQVSATGEVFASPLLLKLLSSISLDKFPNFRLSLQTNGLLAEKNWHKIQHLESVIQDITVSIDAAEPDTYETVRRGGTWEKLTTAMKFLQQKKQQLNFDLRTRMVVQKSNVDEIYKFYQFSNQYNVDRVEFSKITDWRSWSAADFKKHNVFDPEHENYHQTLEQISKVKNLPNVWCHGIFQ